MATALEWGEGSASRPGRFYPGKDLVPIVQEAGYHVIKVIPNLIYQAKNNDLKLLKACIIDAVATSTHNMLRHVNGG